MRIIEDVGGVWPPACVRHCEILNTSKRQSVSKDTSQKKIVGLSYAIDPVMNVTDTCHHKYIFYVSIKGWEYDTKQSNIEFPILKFNVSTQCDGFLNKTSVSEYYINGGHVECHAKKSERVLMASAFFVRQINNNRVPDWERILNFYRLMPMNTYDQAEFKRKTG